jgi:hypothetical protein
MIKVLTILEAFCSKYTSYYYHIRNHFRLHSDVYNIDLFLSPDERIVISSAPYDELVEVWTNNHPCEEDGVRVPKDALLEYLLYIIKAEFNK